MRVNELIELLNNNINEVKEYIIDRYCYWENGEYVGYNLDEISGFEEDGLGDVCVSGIEIGISFRFEDEIDESFKSEGGEDCKIIEIGDKKIGVIGYNI